MNELDKLAQKYGTDKLGKHNYTAVYYDLFKDKVDEVRNVLEIGVAEGAGLKMFRSFFYRAMIYGIDNDPNRLHRDWRINTFLGDQSSPSELLPLELRGIKFDLIIDDGSHNPAHQVTSCLTLMSRLKEGGVYVIEDVSDASIFDQIKGKKGSKFYNFQMIECGERYDDRLIIVQHKNG